MKTKSGRGIEKNREERDRQKDEDWQRNRGGAKAMRMIERNTKRRDRGKRNTE